MKRRLGVAFAILLVVVVIAAAAHWLSDAQRRSISLACENNMMEISMAGNCWAASHGGRFPGDFGSMSNELHTPYFLHCPADTRRQPVASWAAFAASNCSYEMLAPSLTVSDTNTGAFSCPVHGHIGYTDGVLWEGKRSHFKLAEPGGAANAAPPHR